MKRFWKQFKVLIATFFYIGRIPVAPGTFTSLATMLLVYFIVPYREAAIYIHIAAIIIVFLIGIPTASESERYFKKKDPGQCTIDEVAGQMIALLAIPSSFYYYIAGFVLFRIFDILKPPPVKQAEKAGGGFGIMLDDVVAGLYALIIMQIFLFINKTF